MPEISTAQVTLSERRAYFTFKAAIWNYDGHSAQERKHARLRQPFAPGRRAIGRIAAIAFGASRIKPARFIRARRLSRSSPSSIGITRATFTPRSEITTE